MVDLAVDYTVAENHKRLVQSSTQLFGIRRPGDLYAKDLGVIWVHMSDTRFMLVYQSGKSNESNDSVGLLINQSCPSSAKEAKVVYPINIDGSGVDNLFLFY